MSKRTFINSFYPTNSRENCGRIQFDILFSTFSDAEIRNENMDRSKSRNSYVSQIMTASPWALNCYHFFRAKKTP